MFHEKQKEGTFLKAWTLKNKDREGEDNISNI